MNKLAILLLIGLLTATSPLAAAPQASADLNGDGRTDAADLDVMRAHFFGQDARADLNEDGRVNVADLALLKSAIDGPSPRAIDTPPGAPSVFLLPETQSVTVGDTVVVDLYWDFTGEAALGGGTDVFWDPTTFALVSIVFDDNFGTGPGQFDPAFTRCDDEPCSSPGVIDGLATGNFNGLGDPGPIYIASVTFRTLRTGTFPIALAEDAGIAGPFVSAVDFGPYPNIAFAGADIEVDEPPPGPRISVDPPEVDFPDTVVGGGTSVPVRISNVGALPLTIGTIFPPQFPFSITVDGCSGVVLAPTEGCDMIVSFSPPALGPFASVMAINSDDPQEPEVNLVLRGNGVAAPVANISVSGPGVFAPVRPGEMSTAVVVVSNVGVLDLTIGTIGLFNPLEPPFSIALDNCSNRTLSTDDTCTIALRFAPTTGGQATDEFDIPSNDPFDPRLVVNTFGLGIPQIALHTDNLDTAVGHCTNLDTGQSVAAPLDGKPTLPCEAIGLIAGQGDDLQVRMRGRATSATALHVQAFNIGIERARCTNETTGQAVPVIPEDDFDCVAAGLAVTPGDAILLAIQGEVEH